MAQAITLNLTDARFARVVAAYEASGGGATVNAAYVKTQLANHLTKVVQHYEENTHAASFSMTSFAVT